MNKPAKKISIIDQVLLETPKEDAEKIRNRMLLSAKIADGMKSRKIKKRELAKLLDKKPSVITKWISGTHNFTTDTLWDIERVLNINLINLSNVRTEQIDKFQINLTSSIKEHTCLDYKAILFASPPSNKTYRTNHQQVTKNRLSHVEVRS